MEQCTYYGGYYDDSIKPKRSLVYMALEEFMRQRFEKEMEKLLTEMEKKIRQIAVDSVTEIKDLKNKNLKLRDEIDKLKREKVDKPSVKVKEENELTKISKRKIRKDIL